MNDVKHELSRNIDHYLAILSKIYAREGETQRQEILVNATVRIVEEWSYDNWNGGTYGHALYLVLPESLYLGLVREKERLEQKLKEYINKVHNIDNEFIDAVFIEMALEQDIDWRKESGLLLSGKCIVQPQAEKRVWGDEGFRLFLSHKSEVKQQTVEMKKRLRLFGISCFVAHEDIIPTQEWQTEIENALCSMDALVALMTEEFHDSLWTDQEVGFAFGRGVPIISVRLGKDPYGFIGKFQALSCSWETAPKEIVKLLVKYDRMIDSYIKAALECQSFDHGNTLAEVLPSIDKLSLEQAAKLVIAYNENSELRGSFGFSGSYPRYHGPGLAHILRGLTGKTYKEVRGKLEFDS